MINHNLHPLLLDLNGRYLKNVIFRRQKPDRGHGQANCLLKEPEAGLQDGIEVFLQGAEIARHFVILDMQGGSMMTAVFM